MKNGKISHPGLAYVTIHVLLHLLLWPSLLKIVLHVIIILHWLPVKTQKSGSRLSVYGGNEALPCYCFKQLSESQISQSLPEARV